MTGKEAKQVLDEEKKVKAQEYAMQTPDESDVSVPAYIAGFEAGSQKALMLAAEEISMILKEC